MSHGLTLYDNIDLRQPVLVISIASTQCKLAKKNNFMSVDPAKFGKMSLWSSGIVEFVWSFIWDTNVVQITYKHQWKWPEFSGVVKKITIDLLIIYNVIYKFPWNVTLTLTFTDLFRKVHPRYQPNPSTAEKIKALMI